MRILHISSARTYGGGERHLVDLCRGLHEAGHEVFLALRPTNEWQHRLSFLPPGRILHVTLRNSFGMFSAKRIARFMKRNEIGIIHAHLARDYIPASLAARLAGNASFVLTRHVMFGIKPYYRFALGNLSMAIGVSEPAGAALREVFSDEKVTVIRNGIDPSGLESSNRTARRDAFRTEQGIPQGVGLIGVVGELTENKGQKDFLLAAGTISAAHPSSRFILVGRDNTAGGAQRRELRRLAEVLGLTDRVLFLDWVEDTETLFSAIDVLVSSSYSESFGMAILEAMAYATPIVGTRTDGTLELIEDGVTGLLVPIGDPAGLARSVSELLENPERASQIGQAARAAAVSGFPLSRMIEKTLEVYRGLK